MIALNQPLVLDGVVSRGNSSQLSLISVTYNWTCQFSSGINFGLDCTGVIPSAYRTLSTAVVPANSLNDSTSYLFTLFASTLR